MDSPFWQCSIQSKIVSNTLILSLVQIEHVSYNKWGTYKLANVFVPKSNGDVYIGPYIQHSNGRHLKPCGGGRSGSSMGCAIFRPGSPS